MRSRQEIEDEARMIERDRQVGADLDDYEEGVFDALRWVLGAISEIPGPQTPQERIRSTQARALLKYQVGNLASAAGSPIPRPGQNTGTCHNYGG